MPTDVNGRDFWKSYPNMKAHCLTILILVLVFGISLVASISRTSAVQTTVDMLRAQIQTSKEVQAERYAQEVRDKTELMHKLDEASKQNAGISRDLEKIWSAMVISGVSDNVKGGKK